MRVCHVIDSMQLTMGGPPCSVAELTEGLLNQGAQVSVFTIDYKHLGAQLIPAGVDMHNFSGNFLIQKSGGFQPFFQSYLTKFSQKNSQLIHNHGLWLFPNSYARQAAVKNRLPLVNSPRGMLEPWSLKRSQFKKRIAWSLWEYKNLKCAAAFHATSHQEADSIQKLGFKQPIAIIPNSIKLPVLETVASRDILEKGYPFLKGKKWLLFMSRIHPKKGLKELLNVWKDLERKFPQWHLIIAGSDMTGYARELNSFLEQNSLQERVTFTGMLTGPMKEAALANSSLFVLPTHSENFGRVIAESLSYAVPVITTKGAPWEDLEKYMCGWWIDDNEKELYAVMDEAMNLSLEELKNMGQRGRILVEKEFGVSQCARNMMSLYKWLIDGGAVPFCVKIN